MMSKPTNKYKKIEYTCNCCDSERQMFLPDVVSPEIGSSGYAELVDVHICLDRVYKANILYVDHNLVVRSQYPVEPLSKQTATANCESPLGIPIPKKTIELVTQPIIPSELFEKSYLFSLEIKDKLRQTVFSFQTTKDNGNELNAVSSMGFIEMEAKVTPNLTNLEYVQKWLMKASDLLESCVILDDGLLSYIVDYLSYRINEEPTLQKIAELGILINSSYALPTSKKEQADTIVNKDKWDEMISELLYMDRIMYNRIMKLSLENTKLTVLSIFVDIIEKVNNEYTLPDCMSALANLVLRGFLDVKKLSFQDAEP